MGIRDAADTVRGSDQHEQGTPGVRSETAEGAERHGGSPGQKVEQALAPDGVGPDALEAARIEHALEDEEARPADPSEFTGDGGPPVLS